MSRIPAETFRLNRMEICFLPSRFFTALGLDQKLDERARDHLGYLISNLLVLALLPLAHLVRHVCIFRSLTGLPCPGCGVTHAILLALSFDIRGSLAANPAGVPIVATIGFQLIGRPWAIVNQGASRLVSTISGWLGRISVVCLLAAWALALLKLFAFKVST